MADNTSELTALSRSLSPDFAIEREIGRGGMGVVYLGMDLKLERPVAIKVLPETFADKAEVRERFIREARTAAKLSHPNIVPIYRADELRGVVFIVMAFVDGESLAERLATRGTLAATELVSILRDVARALDHAHAHGIVHRDIKPENILIERLSGRAIVTDFGIARLAEAKPLTLTGQVLGTVHYMSPEQISGGTVDGRTDLYSLGVVGFRALTGRLPFESAAASAVLVAHVMTAPPKVRDVAPATPSGVAAIIDRCLVKEPEGRFQSADELARALDDALTVVTPEGATASATRRPRPNMLSDREAQALWSRAAELQAVTGSQERPPAPALPPANPGEGRDRTTVTSGYPFADVRDAALEAGIPERYVDLAAVELGLATGIPGVQSAASLNRVVRPTSRKFLGLPIAVGRTVELDRELSEHEWERLVVDLRETFDARGIVRQDGSFRQWTNGNLQVLLEPSANGHRIRFHTVKGEARGWMSGGLVTLGIAAVATVLGLANHTYMAWAAEIAVIGVGQFALGAIRLPGWARLRRKQMDEISGRLTLGLPSLPSQGARSLHSR